MKKLLLLLSIFSYVDAKTPYVMCMGDSITWGAVSPNVAPALGGYRSPLYEAVKSCGIEVLFIGPDAGNPSPLLTKDKQEHHAGYRGFRIDELCQCLDGPNPYPGNLGYWFTWLGFEPDIILLMAGTNDILQGKGVVTATLNMDKLLIKIHTLRPTATIIVAQIPPIFGSVAKQVEQFNTNLIGLVENKKKAGFDIKIVNMYSSFLGFSKQFGDGVHPDEVTYRAMALVWIPALLTSLWDRHPL